MTSLSQWLMVAAGGAIGASARHGVALLMLSTGWRFPFATLIVNIIGSFLLGAVYAHVQHQGLSESVRLFVGVGLLGAFTTFSTFSDEVVQLATQGERGRASVNIVLDVGLCVQGVAAAMALYNFFIIKPN